MIVNDIKIKLKLDKLGDKKAKKGKQKRKLEKLLHPYESSSKMIKQDLEETRAELSAILDKIMQTVFKKYEEKITTNNVKELLNEWVDTASKKSEESALKAEIENHLDELMTNKIVKRYSGSPVALQEESNKKVNMTDSEVSYIKHLPLERRIAIKKDIQEIMENYKAHTADLDNSDGSKRKSDEKSFMESIKNLCIR